MAGEWIASGLKSSKPIFINQFAALSNSHRSKVSNMETPEAALKANCKF